MSLQIDLTNKTALVSGSSQGIGASIARDFAQAGSRVILLARNEEKLAALCDELNKNHPLSGNLHHHFIAADLAQKEGVAKVISFLEEVKEGIDIYVSNAGGPPGGALSEAKEEEFVAAFQMHLMSSHAIVKSILPSMKERRFGRIINIISTSVKAPLPGLGVSNTLRGAMSSWGKTLASEVASYEITVNSILPGATKTDRLEGILKKKAAAQNLSFAEAEKKYLAEIPQKRFAEPEEVAHLASFLASGLASYINGVAICVDGGRTPCL